MKLRTLLIAGLASIASTAIGQQHDLSDVVAADILPHAHFEVLSEASFSTPVENGDPYLALALFPFQPKLNGGIRAEISVDVPHPADARVTYQWRFRVPDSSENDRKNRWWVMAQWHDQPDVNISETWETKPDTSPSVALGYGVIDGIDHFGLSYGAPEQAHLAAIPFSRGEWHELKVVIDWALGPEGSAVLYLDDMNNPVAQANGRNMYNNFRHYFKLGMYRDPAIHVNSQVHIDDVRITVN